MSFFLANEDMGHTQIGLSSLSMFIIYPIIDNIGYISISGCSIVKSHALSKLVHLLQYLLIHLIYTRELINMIKRIIQAKLHNHGSCIGCSQPTQIKIVMLKH